MAGVETDSLTPRRSGLSLPIEISAITAILALALGLMAGAGAALYQRSRPAKYVSVAVLLIDQPTAVAQNPDAGELQKLQLLRYRYAPLVRTDVIADPVSRQVHLPASQVAAELNAFVDPTSFTINLLATSTSPSESNTVAQAGAAQLISYLAQQQRRLPVIPQNRVILTEVTQPGPGVKQVASTTKVLLSGGIAFVVVAAGFLIVADLLRRRP
jgi:capsular polysaccharide biosynthesis protein